MLAFVVFLLLAAPDAVKVEPDGVGRWRMTITASDETDPLRLAERLRPGAADICGTKGFYFDHYTFTLDQQVPAHQSSAKQSDKLTLVQDVVCGALPAVPAEPLPAPALTDEEALALNYQLEALTTNYFSALDEGRYSDAFATADDAMTGGATLSDWSEQQKRFQASAGAATERRIGRLTWYSNPASAPFGHYGAVDYVASRALQDECGYLIWYRPSADAALRLIRQETTLLPHNLPAETRDTLRKAHCILL